MSAARTFVFLISPVFRKGQPGANTHVLEDTHGPVAREGPSVVRGGVRAY